MKDTLMLKKYNNQTINGTYNLFEERSFFGSKMMEIEDDININNTSIQYYQYFIDTSIFTGSTFLELAKNNGFQYYILNKNLETFFIDDLVQLKLDYHTISKFQQNDIDLKNNTKWQINIDVSDILKYYLFYNIKSSRTFKGLKYTNFINQNINNSILEYITNNVLNRYKFDSIDLYVQYSQINLSSDIYNYRTLLQYNPVFDSSVELTENKVNNVSIPQDNNIDQLSNVILIYNQIKPSTQWTFSYYFNIHYKKI